MLIKEAYVEIKKGGSIVSYICGINVDGFGYMSKESGKKVGEVDICL